MAQIIPSQRDRCTLYFLLFILALSLIFPIRNSFAAEQKIQRALRTPITYSCVDKPINQVLLDIANLANIDIVQSPEVTGTVTVKLTGVPLEEALTNILSAHNYTFQTTENMIRVMPLPQVAEFEERLVTRLYQLKYADANEVAETLRRFLTQRGKVALDQMTSNIMVTDTQDTISGIDKFIEQIDQVTQQVLVEVRVYDVTTREGFKLDKSWHAATNSPLETIEKLDTKTNTVVDSEAPTALQWTKKTTLSVEGEEASNDQAFVLDPGETIGFVPEAYREYSEESVEDETESQDILNPDGYSSNKRAKSKTKTSIQGRRDPFVAGSFDRETGGTLKFSLLDDAIDLEFMLSILHSQVQSNLLANPRVLVLDNETAKFEIVREIPYRELRQVAREDPITYTAFKNVGVDLKVTPHIMTEGLIKLHINPEFSVVTGFSELGAPIVDSRRADTMTMIKDGQTIVLGGLLKKETSKDVSKVPLLGDLPLLGGLFRSESESLNTSELIIFITTKIVTRPQLSQAEKIHYSNTEITSPQMLKMRLPLPSQPAEKQRDVNDISEILRRLLKDTGNQ